MSEERSGSGVGWLLAGFAALGVWLKLSAARDRQQLAELEALRQSPVDEEPRPLSSEAVRVLRRNGILPTPKVRRLTHREAFKALLDGRYLEACRERVSEAEAAAANRAG